MPFAWFPPLTNNCINVIKDTALASVVAMPDLLKQANQAQALEANAYRDLIALLWHPRNSSYRLHQEFAQAVRQL